MRLSADRHDPDYFLFKYSPNRWRVDVYWNGQLIEDVIEADEEAGRAKVYVRDDNGRIAADGDFAVTCWREGEIKIQPVRIDGQESIAS